MTYSQALRRAAARLKDTSDAPELDAERLLLPVVKQIETSWLHAHSDTELTAHQTRSFETALLQRMSGKPLAYILGDAEFYGRTFLVNADVLVPRQETETLVDEALTVIRQLRPRVVADVGTGSGIIAITIALETLKSKTKNNDLTFVATDISPAALVVARENAERHGISARISFVAGDFLDPLASRNIDLIITNPPYIPSHELNTPDSAKDPQSKIETRGLDFEPRLALDGGADGLFFVTKIRQQPVPAVYEALGGIIHRHNC